MAQAKAQEQAQAQETTTGEDAGRQERWLLMQRMQEMERTVEQQREVKGKKCTPQLQVLNTVECTDAPQCLSWCSLGVLYRRQHVGQHHASVCSVVRDGQGRGRDVVVGK